MSFPESRSSIVFSDLDGCLLNADYSYREAGPALARLRALGVPLVLASSKTHAEMEPLAEELGTTDPLICENGGVIAWRGLSPPDNSGDCTILGVPRESILQQLHGLREAYRFRSFTDLGVAGIMQATGLSEPQARRAAARMTTEPLIWDDDDERVADFREALTAAGLTLTRGGRFWHVAGSVNKGDGLAAVLEAMSAGSPSRRNAIALGDSPIDLPMLERADLAIVIPAPDGTVRIHPNNPRQIIAPCPGSAGWNAAIMQWLDDLAVD